MNAEITRMSRSLSQRVPTEIDDKVCITKRDQWVLIPSSRASWSEQDSALGINQINAFIEG